MKKKQRLWEKRRRSYSCFIASMFSLTFMNVATDMIPKIGDKATETNCTPETVLIKEEVRQSRNQLRRLTWAAWKFDFINCYGLWSKRVFRLEPLLIGELSDTWLRFKFNGSIQLNSISWSPKIQNWFEKTSLTPF